jgi:peptidoglycan/LPS O-acetylase OafA/YrhL
MYQVPTARLSSSTREPIGSGLPLSGSRLAYRPDIDGLRAVAVLLVFAYHLETFSIFGGFIGVDVFFVISGFLISSVIFREMDESRFSLLAFYERRIRRIFPALLVMMMVTAIAAVIYLLPSELEDFAKSLLAATFSLSNIYFWKTASYFSSSGNQPLLHSWSLGVEEQFYLLFPLLVLVIRRYLPGKYRHAIIGLAGLSFLVNMYGTYAYPTAAFYLPAARMWELLLGTILALGVIPPIHSRAWRNVLSVGGMLLILASAFTYSNRTHFPGIAALSPCLGAALIIVAGETGPSFVGRLLSLRPVVFIGLISYSLYLYHWPVIVFQRMSMIQFRDASNRSVHASILVFSIILASVSWRFVEIPFRSGKWMLKGASAFKFASAGALGLTTIGIGVLVLRGLPGRYTPREIAISSYMGTSLPTRSGKCFIESGEAVTRNFDAEDCLRQDASRKNYLLIGDSHAAHLWYGLKTVFPEINYLQANASGCEPTLERKQTRLLDPLDNLLWGDICRPMMEYVYNDYLPRHHVDQILIAARWEPEDLPRLDHTIRTLKVEGFNIVLFGPIVQYDSPLPQLLVTSLKENDPLMPARHRLVRYLTLDKELAERAATTWGITYVSYFKLLCPQQVCLEYADKDVPLQSDYGHLTWAGSVLVSQKLKRGRYLGAR